MTEKLSECCHAEVTYIYDAMRDNAECCCVACQKPCTIASKTEIITDGFGSDAPTVCPICHRKAIYVNRPGDIRCHVCYDHNNPEEYELVQSKPDASPDRLLTEYEIKRLLQKTHYGQGYIEIAKAQNAKTYPLAFEAGRKAQKAELERIFQEITNYSYTMSWYDAIQAVKAKYIKASVEGK